MYIYVHLYAALFGSRMFIHVFLERLLFQHENTSLQAHTHYPYGECIDCSLKDYQLIEADHVCGTKKNSVGHTLWWVGKRENAKYTTTKIRRIPRKTYTKHHPHPGTLWGAAKYCTSCIISAVHVK